MNKCGLQALCTITHSSLNCRQVDTCLNTVTSSHRQEIFLSVINIWFFVLEKDWLKFFSCSSRISELLYFVHSSVVLERGWKNAQCRTAYCTLPHRRFFDDDCYDPMWWFHAVKKPQLSRRFNHTIVQNWQRDHKRPQNSLAYNFSTKQINNSTSLL